MSLEAALANLQSATALLKGSSRLRRLMWHEAHPNRKRSDTKRDSYSGRWVSDIGLGLVEHPEICCLLKEQENPPDPSPPSHWYYQI